MFIRTFLDQTITGIFIHGSLTLSMHFLQPPTPPFQALQQNNRTHLLHPALFLNPVECRRWEDTGVIRFLIMYQQILWTVKWPLYFLNIFKFCNNFPTELSLALVQRFLNFNLTLSIWNLLIPGCEDRVGRVTIFLAISPTLTTTKFLNPDISPFRTCHICQ